MKFSPKTLFLVAAFGAFATTSCSEKKAENTADTVENAADNAAENTTNAMDNAVDNAKEDIAREPGDTAVVRNQPADKVVEEIPDKKD
ncbi:hypothetical protein I2I05_17390 [Hymenobacter sp. BT683]|uniref:YtxH domain-containing protein n=1 Tax=Hymenobacter jeongseonensis TaxID=2791027 RepID=A0ABS0ILC9_9BACT|nr:hypothetical protein [Hymenobacter jeongseonensis]MBF9239182.1 hypothetical protein [Hymenobacter jeongseonensis]